MKTEDKLILTWAKYGELIEQLCQALAPVQSVYKCKGVYGVPRGGLPLAVAVSHHLKIPILEKLPYHVPFKKIMLLDDICDTGETIKEYHKYLTVTLFLRKDKSQKAIPDLSLRKIDKWVVFPYERKDE